MNGAESLVHTLLKGGVDTCFANPGTSEMHFVAALDRVPGMRSVLGLFEGVVTGAADGYARMAGKPAATLLHCGPGLANGLANLHNARRAGTPIVNIVGDQATYHRPLDAPLTADTEGWARPVSGFVRTAQRASGVGADVAAAIRAARVPPGQIATLILPADTAWGDGGMVVEPLPPPPAPRVDQGVLARIARVLRGNEPAILVLTGAALAAEGLALAHRIRAATGARIIAQGSNARIAHGAGRVPIERVPYVVDRALAMLAGLKHIVLVGAVKPVAFFAYPDKPGTLYPPDATVHVLARADQDIVEALARLADELGAPAVPLPNGAAARPAPAKGAPTPEAVAQTLSALLPEQAVVVDESVSFGRTIFADCAVAAPHDWLQITGGAIGDGLPLATGAAVGAPGRRVIGLQADGSAMYTVQALWTQARERLDITTILISNRKYAILLHELANVGANPGRTALDMLDLSNPDLDWLRIAGGLGVEGARAETMERFADLFSQSLSRRGPFLIELVV
ncbi:MAG: acetolactate synthase large subunit [Rhodospirillales bacterium]|nr:acetolactate synthase large subunit [Rhodospirillales bacterium]